MKKFFFTLAILILAMSSKAQMSFVEDLTELLHGKVVHTQQVDTHVYMEVGVPKYVELKHVIAGVSVSLNDVDGKIYKDWHIKDGTYQTFVYFYTGDLMHLIHIEFVESMMTFTFKHEE